MVGGCSACLGGWVCLCVCVKTWFICSEVTGVIHSVVFRSVAAISLTFPLVQMCNTLL